MRSVEAEGGSIDVAISRALEALGAVREEVHVDILEGSSPGVLGSIGRRKARVRATMQLPIEQWLAGGSPTMEEGPRPGAASEQGRQGDGRRDGAVTSREEARVAAESTLGGPAAVAPAIVVQEIFRWLDVDVSVAESGKIEVPSEPRAQSIPTPRLLSVLGRDVEDVIGAKGEVLEAIEYLLNRMLDHGHAGQRYALDAPGYGSKRRAALEDPVRRMVARARERRRMVTLDTMSPGDRRIVLELLKGERGITAASVGQGFYRKQTLTPERVRTGGSKKSR